MEVDERCVDVKIAVAALVVGIDVDVVQTISTSWASSPIATFVLSAISTKSSTT